MIRFFVWTQLVKCFVMFSEPQKDRYVVRENKSFEMDCNHKLETVTRVSWRYISTHDNNKSETIYDSQQPNNTLKTGFEVSCQPHETFISTCILKLVQARKENSGKYICYVGQENETRFDSNLLKLITEIELVIRGPTYKTLVANKGASVILPCEHNITNITRTRWSHFSVDGVLNYAVYHMPGKGTSNKNYEALCEPHGLSCNLKILQANKESAGKYICMVGESLEFEMKYGLDQMTYFIEIELVVGELECNENMNKDLTLIGENDCYGIEADVLNLKCSFNYFGNIDYNVLHLRWIGKYKFNSLEKKLNSSPINSELDKISIQTNLSVAYEMQNSVFQCVLDDTDVKPCQLNEFRTQYVKNTSESPPTLNSDDLQNKMCTANKSANVQCLYYWVHETSGAILDNPFLPVENMKSLGNYTCFAKCQLISHEDCIIKAMQFEVVQRSQLTGINIGLITGLILSMVTVIIIIMYVCLKKYKKLFSCNPRQEEENTIFSEQEPLLEENLGFTVKTISTSSTFKEKRVHRKVKLGCNLLEMKKILHKEKSKHHDIMIYESTQNGNVFMLDGAVWTTEFDSWNKKALIYPLVHHEGAKRVLVVGGGDGTIVTHLLKNCEVESVTVYEIDELIIKLSRKYFPSLAYFLDDPKVKVHISDINNSMRERVNAFDVIIIRSTSVQGEYLVKEYYEFIKKALKEGGVASLTVTGNHKEYVTQCDVMKTFVMDLCKQIFPVVQYFYFQEHPDSVTRCIMCSLNPEINFEHLYGTIVQGSQDKVEETIAKILEGCNPSRINFISRVLKNKNIRTIEDFKTLDSNAWVSLSGLTDVEINKIREYFNKAAEEAFSIALNNAHDSRKDFFADVLKENLDLIALKNLDHNYVVDSLKCLSRAEISKIKEIAENKLKGICLYSDWQDSFKKDFTTRGPLTTCSWLNFEVMEALKRFSDDEIEQIKTFTSKSAIVTVEGIFKGFESSRINFIESVFKEYGISGLHSFEIDLKLLETCGKLSASEIEMIKRSYKKWHEMTVEELLVSFTCQSSTLDFRVLGLIEVAKKIKSFPYIAKGFVDLIKWGTNLYAFDTFNYAEITKMKISFETTLKESVAEALKDSGVLRINFVLKALSRKGLGFVCRFIYYGDMEKCDATYHNPLNVLQELSETEISKIMAFHNKSLKEAIKEILEGYDGSKIDFVEKILNKYGISRQFHLLEYRYKLRNIGELTDDEVNKIEEFISKSKCRIEHLLKKLGITDENRITFILKLMENGGFNTSTELIKHDWLFFDILTGLRDSEAKKLVEFIQTKKMTIDETLQKIFKELDSSRINIIKRTLEKNKIYTIEDFQFLDSNDWEDLRGMTYDEFNKIKDFLGIDTSSESNMGDLNLA